MGILPRMSFLFHKGRCKLLDQKMQEKIFGVTAIGRELVAGKVRRMR
jgi:hypothetical protein